MKRGYTYRSGTSSNLRQSPFVLFFVFVVQRFDLLLFLLLAYLVRVCDLEELWCELNQPLWFDHCDIVAVFTSRQDQFVINQPLRISVEQRRRRMYIDRCAFNKGFVPFRKILLRSMPKETRADSFAHTIIIPPGRNNIMFIAES